MSAIVGAREAVAAAAHGVDQARPARVVADRAAQRHDVVVDLAQRGLGVEAGDLLDDVDARHDLAAALGQHLEHQDVVGGELDRPARRPGRQRAEVEAHAAERQLGDAFAGRGPCARRRRARTRARSSRSANGLAR